MSDWSDIRYTFNIYKYTYICMYMEFTTDIDRQTDR